MCSVAASSRIQWGPLRLCCCTPLSIVFVASSPWFTAMVLTQHEMIGYSDSVEKWWLHFLKFHICCWFIMYVVVVMPPCIEKKQKKLLLFCCQNWCWSYIFFFTKMHWQSTDFFTSIAGWHSFFRGFREQSWKTEFFNQVSKSERSELTDFDGFFFVFFQRNNVGIKLLFGHFSKDRWRGFQHKR